MLHSLRKLGNYLLSMFIKYRSSSRISKSSIWEDLPDDIIKNIVQRLSTLDRLRFSRAIKSVTIKGIPPPPHHLPWYVTDEMKFFDFDEGKLVDLKLAKMPPNIWWLECSRGWLIYLERSFDYVPWNLIHKVKQFMAKLIPLKSFSGFLSKIKQPSIETEKLFLFNPISKSLHRFPSLSTMSSYQHHEHPEPEEYCSAGACCFCRIIVSCSDASQLIVAAQINRRNTTNNCETLALCRPGDEKWSIFVGYPAEEFHDILFYRGKLLVLVWYRDDKQHHDGEYRIKLEGYDNDQVIIFISWVNLLGSIKTYDAFLAGRAGPFPVPSLVESTDGQLFMVIKTVQSVRKNATCIWTQTGEIFVFKVDVESSDFQRIYDIGDQVIFIGIGGPESFPTSGGSNLQGNCIYFAEHMYQGGRESGVYSLQDGKFRRIIPLTNFPGTPSLGWLVPNSY